MHMEPGMFKRVGPDVQAGQPMDCPPISEGRAAFKRLRENKLAMVCLIFLALMIFLSVVCPMISGYSASEQHQDHGLMPMGYTHTETVDGKAVRHTHLWGTDKFGRDLFTRVWMGARISLFIALAAAAINLVLGALYGGVAGYCGGKVDQVMMRLLEIVGGIPYMMVAILLLTVMSPGIGAIVLAYAATGWMSMARLVRGQVLRLKESEYVLAARAMGARGKWVLFRHLLPNCLPVMIVNMTLTVPDAIFAEAFLSYLGLGVPIPMASWGTLLSDGAAYFRTSPHLLFLPALLMVLTMLALNLLGDALGEALDPRMKG